jgi:hypothetical protein
MWLGSSPFNGSVAQSNGKGRRRPDAHGFDAEDYHWNDAVECRPRQYSHLDFVDQVVEVDRAREVASEKDICSRRGFASALITEEVFAEAVLPVPSASRWTLAASVALLGTLAAWNSWSRTLRSN